VVLGPSSVLSTAQARRLPGRIVKQVVEVHRPLLLTSRGRGVAVVQALDDFEQAEEERAFMRGVVQGMMDLESGREVEIVQVTERLGLV
jgi:prevent-host-death family protein